MKTMKAMLGINQAMGILETKQNNFRGRKWICNMSRAAMKVQLKYDRPLKVENTKRPGYCPGLTLTHQTHIVNSFS